MGMNENLTDLAGPTSCEVLSLSEDLRSLLDQMPIRVFIKDLSGRYVACNRLLASDLGRTPEEVIGRNDFDLFPHEVAEMYQAGDRAVLEQETVQVFEEFYPSGDHPVWVRARKSPWRSVEGRVVGILGQVEDITEAHRLEDALRRKSSLYTALAATNDVMIRAVNEAQLFAEVCEILIRDGGLRLAWFGRAEGGDSRIVAVAKAGPASGYLDTLIVHGESDLPTGHGPVGHAWRKQGTVVVGDFLSDPNCLPWQQSASRYALHACVALPVNGGDFHGVLTVYAGEIDFFDADLVSLLEKMAEDIAFSLQRMKDAEAKRQAESELRLLARVFEESAEGMAITDARNCLIHVNRAFSEITGYSPEEVLGQNPSLLKSGKHETAFYQKMWSLLLAHGVWQGEIWNRRKDGALYPQWATINLVRDAAGKVINHFAIFRDISAGRAAAEIDYLKRFDALTGLPNRMLLEDRAREAIAHAREYNRFVALLFVNLDHFHLVNDLLGYVSGDRVLEEVARRLVEAVGSLGTVTRLSGDTFAVLLPDLNSPESVSTVADTLLGRISDPMALGREVPIDLTACIGIALWPSDGEDFDTIMQHADVAMQSARSFSRNNYLFFTRDMNRSNDQLFVVSRELRSALSENRLFLDYQPWVEVSSGRVTGIEALVRIRHPERGVLSPAEFIAIAEETGLIVQVGAWVVREACRQMVAWREAGIGDMLVSINISPMQLRQPDFVDMIAGALKATGLEGRYLELELVEGALIQDIEASLQLMHRLKGLGLHLAIDDFGTGYSSLSHLKRFPVDKLKIDRGFIRNITTDPNDATIVQAIIALARTLGPTTIAEGVETEAQFRYLRNLRCDLIQGYWFSPPVSPDGILDLVARARSLEAVEGKGALLLVDDEESVLNALKRLLRRHGFRILTANNAEEGLEILAREPVSVVLSDQRMPGMGGVEFLRRVKTMHPRVVRMILSGYSDLSTITEAINSGEVYKFINKPWENDVLVDIIREAFARYEHATPVER